MASGDITVEQLKKQLEKSEAGRNKLRETVGLLREKALNTGELLRQHRVLKDKYETIAEELEEERSAREEAAAEVKHAKQIVTESTKEIKSSSNQLRSSKGQSAAAQKAATDAAKTAAAALTKAHTATQEDVRVLKREVALLHEQRKKNASENSATAATQAEVARLSKSLVRLQVDLRQQDARLQKSISEGHEGARAAAVAHIKYLEEEVAAQKLEQKRMASEMERWRTMFGSLFSNFAAALGRPTADDSPPLQGRGTSWPHHVTAEHVIMHLESRYQQLNLIRSTTTAV